MIPVYCHTNIDEFQFAEWPKELLGIPHKGDKIQAIGPVHYRIAYGPRAGYQATIPIFRLVVVDVVHVTPEYNSKKNTAGVGDGPYIDIELHSDKVMAQLWGLMPLQGM